MTPCAKAAELNYSAQQHLQQCIQREERALQNYMKDGSGIEVFGTQLGISYLKFWDLTRHIAFIWTPPHQPPAPRNLITSSAPPPDPDAIRKERIRAQVTIPGIVTIFLWRGERETLSARVIGFKASSSPSWWKAPYIDGQAPAICMNQQHQRRHPETPLINGRETGTEVGGERVYFKREGSNGRTFVMIPANQGYVPVRHGGDPLTGDWLAPVAQNIHKIVFDTHGWRHPSYPDVDYEKHGFQSVRDWRGRICFWPMRNGDFQERPDRVPLTHIRPLHEHEDIPRVSLPASNDQQRGRIRGVAVALQTAAYASGLADASSLTGRVAAGAVQNRLASEAVEAYRELSGEARQQAEYLEAVSARNERISRRGSNLRDQDQHNRELTLRIQEDRSSLHPEILAHAAEQRLAELRAREQISTDAHRQREELSTQEERRRAETRLPLLEREERIALIKLQTAREHKG